MPLPHIGGHEFAGVVAETGPAVSEWRAGDRVTAPFACGCGRCEYCRAGQAQVCAQQTQPGFTGPGSFAELVVLSTLAIAALYTAGCAASWVLARRGVALSGTPLDFRFLGFAAVIGISSMLALIALGSRQEIIGLATLIGLSILLYLIQTRIAVVKSH